MTGKQKKKINSHNNYFPVHNNFTNILKLTATFYIFASNCVSFKLSFSP